MSILKVFQGSLVLVTQARNYALLEIAYKIITNNGQC